MSRKDSTESLRDLLHFSNRLVNTKHFEGIKFHSRVLVEDSHQSCAYFDYLFTLCESRKLVTVGIDATGIIIDG